MGVRGLFIFLSGLPSLFALFGAAGFLIVCVVMVVVA